MTDASGRMGARTPDFARQLWRWVKRRFSDDTELRFSTKAVASARETLATFGATLEHESELESEDRQLLGLTLHALAGLPEVRTDRQYRRMFARLKDAQRDSETRQSFHKLSEANAVMLRVADYIVTRKNKIKHEAEND